MKPAVSVLLLALILFVPLFITSGIGSFDFWWWMTANLVILLTVVQFVDARWREVLVADLTEHPMHKVALGVLSAVALYIVFWLGNKACRYLLAGAGQEISAIYAFKDQAPALRIVLLMIFVIGPGEELFWRGFLQRQLGDALGERSGWLLATTAYTAIHLAGGNPILVLAAGVCGLFWGWLYRRHHSMLLNAVSHTLWDIAAFLLFPFN